MVPCVNQEVVYGQNKGPSEEKRRDRSPSEKESSVDVIETKADWTGTHKSGCWRNSCLAFAVPEEVEAITGKAIGKITGGGCDLRSRKESATRDQPETKIKVNGLLEVQKECKMGPAREENEKSAGGGVQRSQHNMGGESRRRRELLARRGFKLHRHHAGDGCPIEQCSEPCELLPNRAPSSFGETIRASTLLPLAFEFLVAYLGCS